MVGAKRIRPYFYNVDLVCFKCVMVGILGKRKKGEGCYSFLVRRLVSQKGKNGHFLAVFLFHGWFAQQIDFSFLFISFSVRRNEETHKKGGKICMGLLDDQECKIFLESVVARVYIKMVDKIVLVENSHG